MSIAVSPTSPDEGTLIAQARAGDRAALDALFAAHQAPLRGLLRRMVGHPEDVSDLLQQTLLKALESLPSFRGRAKFGTWLHTIATRTALDFLRARRRYRAGAQVYAQDHCIESGEVSDVLAALASPELRFDTREHIAYCFTCVSRSLPPDHQAALLLRDVYEQTNDEAAEALGVTKSVLRHRLREAREQMVSRFDGLCALVSKTGVCRQCAGLREGVAAERRGIAPDGLLGDEGTPREARYAHRLRVVRDADLDGQTRALHDVMFRQIDRIEQAQSGDDYESIPAPRTRCEATRDPG